MKCPNCGRKGLLFETIKCVSCEKKCCKNCAFFVLKITSEDRWACSADCRQKYEMKVLEHPVGDIGAELNDASRSIENELWHEACFFALDKNSSEWKYWTSLLKFGSARED